MDSLYTYLFVYNRGAGSREEIRKFIDSRNEIVNWYICLDNAFFIVSGKTADQLYEIFKGYTKPGARFIILDTKTDRSGWLPPKAWSLMDKPSLPETPT